MKILLDKYHIIVYTYYCSVSDICSLTNRQEYKGEKMYRIKDMTPKDIEGIKDNIYYIAPYELATLHHCLETTYEMHADMIEDLVNATDDWRRNALKHLPVISIMLDDMKRHTI